MSEAKRLKALEAESAKLKKLLAEHMLEVATLIHDRETGSMAFAATPTSLPRSGLVWKHGILARSTQTPPFFLLGILLFRE